MLFSCAGSRSTCAAIGGWWRHGPNAAHPLWYIVGSRVRTAKKGYKGMRRQRGVFEKVKGSGDWWIVYYVAGQRHREHVGSY